MASRLPLGLCLAIASLIVGPHPATAQPCAYVANEDDGTVSIIDTATDVVTLIIRVGSGPHGVAVGQIGTGPALVYVTNRNESAITVIDTSTQTATRRITVEPGPEAVAVVPQGTTVYVSHPDAGKVSVIDAQSSTVTTTIDVGGTPRGIAASPDGKRVFVVDAANARVLVIDTATNSVTETYQTGSNPTDVAVAPDGLLTYISSVPIAVLNTATGDAVAALGLGSMTEPHGIAITPDNTTALLCVKDPSGGSVLLIGTDPATRIIPFPAVSLGVAAVPIAIAVAPNSASAYVTDGTGDRVAVIDTTGSVTTSIAVGRNPQGIAIASDVTDCHQRPTPTPTATAASCPGDCNGNEHVAINELIIGVNIALGTADVHTCPAFDTSGNGMVAINELIAAVNAALTGCAHPA